MKIEINKEDYEFLKDLQHELLTQENDGNADPVFWGVMEKKEVSVPDGCGDCSKIVYDDGAWDLKEAVEEVNGCISEYSQDVQEAWGNVDKSDISDIYYFMTETLKWNNVTGLFDFKEIDELCRFTGAFITKRACKEYVEKYSYNHSQPRTYAMTAYRNFELERLLNILKTIDLKDEA